MGSDNEKRRALSTKEVAVLFGVATNTVRNFVDRGQLEVEPSPDPPGRRANMKFAWDTVGAFAASQYRREVSHPDDSPPAEG